MSEMGHDAEWFFNKPGQWQACYRKLRAIALDSQLTEEVKWGKPCYTLDGSNVFLIHGFKEYCALLFMKGVLMADPQGILVQQTENVQSARQIRFADIEAIEALEPFLGGYIRDAVAVERSGLKVAMKKREEFDIPEELQEKFEEFPALMTAFEALTPGRQRAYNMHFSSPKQAKTRYARIEKCIPQILEGKGLNDR